MKKMVFCGFMSVMCMVAVGVDKPAPSKAPGERPRVEAKKPDEVARPSAVQPDAKPVVARKPGEARKPAAGARAPRGRAARGARKGAPVVGRPSRGRVRGVVEAGSFPTSPAERRLIEAVEDAETSRELSRLMPQVLASQNPDVRQAMVDARFRVFSMDIRPRGYQPGPPHCGHPCCRPHPHASTCACCSALIG